MKKVSAALIIRDNKILLTKRTVFAKSCPGTWAFPGGYVETKETPKQTAVREVKEETGLDFNPIKEFYEEAFEDKMIYKFLGHAIGKVKIQEAEVLDCGWFSYEEAMKLELGFDCKPIIHELMKENLIK